MRLRLASAGVLTLLPVLAYAADEGGEKKGMPQLDPSTFPSQIFWLAVFFALFYGFMQIVAMPRLRRIIEARQARISDDLNHATTASGDAQALKSELDKSLAGAREEARSVIAAANDEIRKDSAAGDARLSAELVGRIDRAEAAIAAARSDAMGSIEQIAGGILAEALPKVAAVHASNDEVSIAISRAARARS